MAKITFSDIFGNWFRSKKMLSGDYDPTFENIQVGNENPTFLPAENLADIYNRVAHLQMIINRIGGMLSNGKWKVINKQGEEVNDPIINVLNNPNILQSGKDFLFHTSISQDIYGNAFIYRNEAFSGVKSMWNIPELEVKTTGKIYTSTTIDEVIDKYLLNVNGAYEEYLPEVITLLKGSGNGSIFSESKIKTLLPQVSNIYQAYKSRNVLITERGGIGFVSIERNGSNGSVIPMSPDEKKEAEKKWSQNYGIGKGQRRTAFTTVPLKFVSTNLPTKDLMLFEEIEDDLSVICDSFGYNINLLKDAKYSNAKEYEKQVYQNTVIPKAEKIAQKLSKDLGLTDRGLTLTLDFSHIQALQEDKKLKAETIERMVSSLEKLNTIESADSDINSIKEKIKQMMLKS